jgi:hypothetical protein
MNQNQLILEEKEQIIASWRFPFPDYLNIIKISRNDRLALAQSDEKRNELHAEYEDKVNRLIAWSDRASTHI